MLLVVLAARPGIMVDTAQAGEIEQRRKIIGDYILDILAFPFRWDRHRFDPGGHTLRHIFLKKSLPLDSVWITAQHQRPILEKWQKIFRDAIVVGHQVALGVARFRKEHFVEMSQPEALPLEIESDRLLFPRKKFGFDRLLLFQYR